MDISRNAGQQSLRKYSLVKYLPAKRNVPCCCANLEALNYADIELPPSLLRSVYSVLYLLVANFGGRCLFCLQSPATDATKKRREKTLHCHYVSQQLQMTALLVSWSALTLKQRQMFIARSSRAVLHILPIWYKNEVDLLRADGHGHKAEETI
jgi:hypothetical protein